MGTLDYPKLLWGNTCIRLLELFGPSSDGTIHCSLKSFDHNRCPNYRALSYTWDSPFPEDEDESRIQDWYSPTQLVFCNHKPFYIRQNLYDALQTLIERGLTGFYWIDSICINQSDDHERGAQVAMMGDIFSCAREVVCWLGRADAHLEGVVELHRRLPPLIEEFGLDELVEKGPDDIDMILHKRMLEQEPVEAASFLATESLCESCLTFWKRRWFERVWVVQEVALAERLLVLCGAYDLEWDSMACVAKHAIRARYKPEWRSYKAFDNQQQRRPGHAVRLLNRIRDDQHDPIPKTSLLDVTRATQTERKYALLLDTLLDTSKMYATNPRDKIYGVLGMLSKVLPEVQLASLRVDYTISASLLFTQVASTLITELPYLSILGIGPSLQLSSEETVPSWIPDFASDDLWSYLIAHRNYKAGTTTERGSTRKIKEGQLMLYGHMLGTISQTISKSLQSSNHNFVDNIRFLSIPSASSVLQPDILASYFRTKTSFDGRNKAYSSRERKALLKAVALQCLRGYSAAVPGDYISDFITSLQTLRNAGYERYLPSQQDLEDQIIPAKYLAVSKAADEFYSLARKKELSYTKCGLLVGTRVNCQPGDHVWIIRDAQVPIVLRPVPDSTNFTLVGAAYVDGVMFGEALTAEDCPEPVKITIV